ncbi:MAG: LysR family transcriptional regulator [Myxococcota bacterium]
MSELDLNDVSVFVRVVQTGSFSAAARSLHMAKSSVSRCVARLEERLETRLLQRTPRATVPTDAGQAYFEQVGGALTAILDASEAATSRRVPRGTVRITAPPGVGSEALPELVTRFVARYDEVAVEVDLSASAPNPVESGFDLAIRGGPQPDSSLVVRKLRNIPLRLYAAPGYLSRAGSPGRPEDLATHDCVLFRGRQGRCCWRLTGPDGDVEVIVRGRLGSNGLPFVRRAAIAGAGIALLPEPTGESAVRRDLLAPVLPDYALTASPLYLIYPSARHVPLRVRLFRDFLLEHFPSEVDAEIDAEIDMDR